MASDTDREALQRAIGSVLFNVINFPEKAQSRLLGQDMAPLNEKLTDAVQAAGFRLQGEVTDAQVEAAYRVLVGADRWDRISVIRAALEAAGEAAAAPSESESWGVYEDAIGVLWQVGPATEEKARREAVLAGPGHRPVPVEVGKGLANAWSHGKFAALEATRSAA